MAITIVVYTAFGLLLIYGVIIQLYNVWWQQMPGFNAAEVQGWKPTTKISVIIPARNEAANIGACLDAILQQDYPSHLIQVIVIDDNSTDDTFKIVSSSKYARMQLTGLQLTGEDAGIAPKKRAIAEGIAVASGDLIVTTDADCVAGPQWLSSIAACHYQTKKVFIAAPVRIKEGDTLLSRFQALDFLTMQGITGAAAYKRFHNMCNGANLAYEKKVFHEVGGFNGIDHIASGDDMLLMGKIVKKYPAQTGFLKSKMAIVTTQAASSWKEFFQQRIRWASKSMHYKDNRIFLVLLLVWLTNLSILTVAVMGFWYPAAWLLFLFICVCKFFIELFFVQEVAGFFGQQSLLLYLLALQPMHMVYIVVSGVFGQFKSYEWKGRKLK
jgi:cellulose synthase/poly-beta-1,6-N-acetylglucosamine synthase-like glycosyltransferase